MSAWYVSQQRQQSGPLSEDQLRQMSQSGQLAGDTYVSGPGLSGWTPAAQVPLLASPAAAAPAPQQPAAQGMAMTAPMGGPPPGMGGAPAAAMGPLGVPGPAPMGAPGPLGVSGPAPMGAPGPMGAPMGMAGAGVAAQGAAPKGDWVKERLKGLLAVALAMLVVVGNLASIWYTSTFYPKSVIVGLGALGYGGWVMVFGDEFDDDTMELVKWKQIGMYAAGGIGVLIGVIVSVLIAE